MDYRIAFDDSITETFTAARRLATEPSLAVFALKTMLEQKAAADRRRRMMAEGIEVPPIIIFSVTKRCNLACAGCYHRASHRSGEDLPLERIRALFGEAEELGISLIPLAGGEPMTRPEIIEAAGEHPNIVFPVFTNGLLIDENIAKLLRGCRNLVPIISLEGGREETDLRRGAGVFDGVMASLSRLKAAGVFFGVSITVTNLNEDEVTTPEYAEWLTGLGARIIVYVEYVPLEPGTEGLVLTKEQRGSHMAKVKALGKDSKALVISFPGNEDAFGGCLAAGRGFLHLSPDGRLEPCPASPYSDTGIRDHTLKEALNSPLLKKIRSKPSSLKTTTTGCALLDRKDWVLSLVGGKT